VPHGKYLVTLRNECQWNECQAAVEDELTPKKRKEEEKRRNKARRKKGRKEGRGVRENSSTGDGVSVSAMVVVLQSSLTVHVYIT
jgi:hypothetical protein